MEGKWSLRVELGVEQWRSIAVAFFGRYELVGGTASPSTIGDLTLRRNRKGGALVQMSVRHRNSGEDSLRVFFKRPGTFVQNGHLGRARARFCLSVGWFGLVSAHHYSFFPFLFLPELGNS
jgi:hypothetical protein